MEFLSTHSLGVCKPQFTLKLDPCTCKKISLHASLFFKPNWRQNAENVSAKIQYVFVARWMGYQGWLTTSFGECHPNTLSMCKCHEFYERTLVHQLNLQGFHISIEFKVITIPVSFSSAGDTGDLVLTSCVIQNIKPQILWGEKEFIKIRVKQFFMVKETYKFRISKELGMFFS